MVLGPDGTEGRYGGAYYGTYVRSAPPAPGMRGSYAVYDHAGFLIFLHPDWSLVLQFPFLVKVQDSRHHARRCGIPRVVATSGCADMPRQVGQLLNFCEEDVAHYILCRALHESERSPGALRSNQSTVCDAHIFSPGDETLPNFRVGRAGVDRREISVADFTEFLLQYPKDTGRDCFLVPGGALS